jgi:hypothetical protein
MLPITLRVGGTMDREGANIVANYNTLYGIVNPVVAETH